MQTAKQQPLQEQPAAPDPVAGGCYTRDPRTGALMQVKPDAGSGAADAPADHPKTQQE